jgi:hypothetical protein
MNLKITFVQKGPGFRAVGAKLPAAIAAGLNEGGEKVRTRVQQSLWKQTGATKYSSITQRVRVAPSGASGLAYGIVVAGRPVMKISEFKWKATGKGVEAKTWGVDHLFKRSFLLHGGFKARLGPSRFPVRTLYGPNLAKELTQGATPQVFAAASRAYVGPAILKHLARVL